MKITTALIRSFDPCYDPVTGLGKNGRYVNAGYLSGDYEATVVEFLEHPKIPAKDKFWLVLREEILDAKTMRLFAVWCAREVLSPVGNPDKRSINAIGVTEEYAHGQATKYELSAAKAAAIAVASAAWERNEVWDTQLKKLISMLCKTKQ